LINDENPKQFGRKSYEKENEKETDKNNISEFENKLIDKD